MAGPEASTQTCRAAAIVAKQIVIDLRTHRRLPQAVTLAQIKADRTFVDLPIVRQGRLSVSPVTAPQWKRVLQLAGAED